MSDRARQRRSVLAISRGPPTRETKAHAVCLIWITRVPDVFDDIERYETYHVATSEVKFRRRGLE